MTNPRPTKNIRHSRAPPRKVPPVMRDTSPEKIMKNNRQYIGSFRFWVARPPGWGVWRADGTDARIELLTHVHAQEYQEYRPKRPQLTGVTVR
jgi:hypothetical protein